MMNKLTSMMLGGACLLLLGTAGCGGTCSSYCETLTYCTNEDLQHSTGGQCELDDIDALIDDCIEECDQAYERLNGDEADEADACFDCVAEDIGAADECRDGDLNDAINHCDRECDERGVEEFFQEFDGYIRDSDINC